MANIFLSSDFHFNHDRSFIWKDRGFNSVEEMNNAIVKRFNSKINPEDTLYILGDVALGTDIQSAINLIKSINGRKILIVGNHDTPKKIEAYKKANCFEEICYSKWIKFKKKIIVLSHYPVIVSNKDENKAFCFHGHTHSKNKFCEFPYCYNVAVDAHQCYPVEISEAFSEINDISKG